MYSFSKKLTKSKSIATLISILYMLMPYHLTDMYIRNAIGEFLSYIFVPLVFLGLYNLFHKEKGDWLLCIGAVRLNLYTYFNDIPCGYYGKYICSFKYCEIKR